MQYQERCQFKPEDSVQQCDKKDTLANMNQFHTSIKILFNNDRLHVSNLYQNNNSLTCIVPVCAKRLQWC